MRGFVDFLIKELRGCYVRQAPHRQSRFPVRESPTANVPPDPPKPAKATTRTRLKAIPSKGEKQTSMFNFISRSSASKGQYSSSRENQF